MELHGFNPVINFENMPASLRVLAAPQIAVLKKILPGYQGLLMRLAKEKYIIHPSSQIALDVLKSCVPMVKGELGSAYLGLSLGGSLVRGLGTPATSDVDFFIYVRGDLKEIGEKAERCVERIRWKLTQNRLRPCDIANPVYEIENGSQFTPVAVSGVLANLFIDQAVDLDQMKGYCLGLLRNEAACNRWIRCGGKPALLQVLKNLYFAFTMSDILSVASRYRKNFLMKRDDLSEQEMGTINGELFIHYLQEYSRPYIEQRRQLLPFPMAIEIALSGD